MGQSPRYKNKNINLFLTKYSCLGYYLVHIYNFVHRAVMISINLKNIGWAAKITGAVKKKYKAETAGISRKPKGWGLY